MFCFSAQQANLRSRKLRRSTVGVDKRALRASSCSFTILLYMAEQKTILLIEDEPLLGNLLKQRLEKEGIQVVLKRDGEEGLSALREFKPDLVLLDIILPKISGFEILENLKADPQLEKAPVIIVSNLGQDSDIARGQSLGAIQYFVKAKLSIEDLVEQTKLLLQAKSV